MPLFGTAMIVQAATSASQHDRKLQALANLGLIFSMTCMAGPIPLSVSKSHEIPLSPAARKLNG